MFVGSHSAVRLLMASAVITMAAAVAVPAWGNQSEQDQTPQGANFGCPLCHQDGVFGAGNRTPFGAQVAGVAAGGNYDWSAIYNLDADGDGASNGLELGDPDGLWRTGAPDPEGPVTDPNDPNALPDPCGNGALDDGELCDGAELGGESCESQGFDEGTLRCKGDCTFDTGACRAEGDGFCGDNLLNGGEACDGERLLGRTCITQGYTGGELVCADDCTIDTSGCVRDGDPVCGDGVRSGGEACDGVFLAGVDCVSLGAGTGDLSCGDDCAFDTAACAEPEVCDDGADNDGDGGADCEDRDCLGFPGCPICGDGVAEGIEPCDGEDIASSCQDEGFGAGTLSCTPTCEANTSECLDAGGGGGGGGGCTSALLPATISWRNFLARR
jgi:hypothetical protein